MKKKFSCPNCGKTILVSKKTNPMACPECKAGLVWVSGSKLILADPLPTYLDKNKADANAQRPDQVLDQRPLQLSKARLEKAAFYASERILQERTFNKQGLYSGLGVLIAGGLLLLFMSTQIGLGELSWVVLVGMGIGIIFVGLGLFVVAWFALALRSNR